jgi:hypothetical protein
MKKPHFILSLIMCFCFSQGLNAVNVNFRKLPSAPAFAKKKSRSGSSIDKSEISYLVFPKRKRIKGGEPLLLLVIQDQNPVIYPAANDGLAEYKSCLTFFFPSGNLLRGPPVF